MINFGKFTFGRLSKHLIHNNILNFMKKNYLSTSQNRTSKKDEKIDLREEFQEMLKETKISDEEVQKMKLNEETKKTESINQAKKEFAEKTEKLKNEFESNRTNTENEKSDNKKKSTFNFGKEEESNNKNTEETPGAFSKFLTGFKKVWKQTFPGEENLELLIEKRKAEAQFLKSKIITIKLQNIKLQLNMFSTFK